MTPLSPRGERPPSSQLTRLAPPRALPLQMGHTDLGDFHFERGDFQSAFKCFVRTRDYCTTSKHIIGAPCPACLAQQRLAAAPPWYAIECFCRSAGRAPR